MKVKFMLILKYRDGRVEVVKVEKGGRPTSNTTTVWWLRILSSILSYVSKGYPFSVSFTDTDGVARTQNFITGTGTTYAFSSGCGDLGIGIILGSDTTAPADTQYKIGYFQASTGFYTTVDETYYRIYSRDMIDFPVDLYVCEAALYKDVCTEAGTKVTVMLSRVTFSCKSIPADTLVTVYYTISL